MQTTTENTAFLAPNASHTVLQDQNFLAFIRNRLNVIGTSMYLLKGALEKDSLSRQRYIDKINYELEILCESINK